MKPSSPRDDQFLPHAGETLRSRLPSEIVAGKAVVVLGGLGRSQRLERGGKLLRHRVGDEHVPAGADFGRGGQHAFDQGLDRFGVVVRTRRLQQSGHLVPVRLG